MTAPLTGVAVVTGSSSGIGRAVARALAGQGMRLCLTGRDPARLQDVAREVASQAAQVVVYAADLSTDEGIRSLVGCVEAELGQVDVLVHAAGALNPADIEAAGWEDLCEQCLVNLRTPFLLTKALLPALKKSEGQLVFVNSTAGLAPSADNVLYAATKHALGALARGLRDHVNQYGIRVLSVFPGRTATSMQEAVHRFEGRSYQPENLLQPDDVAEVIVAALSLPRRAEVTDVVMRPMKKPAPGR